MKHQQLKEKKKMKEKCDQQDRADGGRKRLRPEPPSAPLEDTGRAASPPPPQKASKSQHACKKRTNKRSDSDFLKVLPSEAEEPEVDREDASTGSEAFSTDSDEDSILDENGLVQVDFEGRDISDADYHAVKTLLMRYLSTQFEFAAIGEMVDYILQLAKDPGIGNVVYPGAGDEDTVLAFITAIPLHACTKTAFYRDMKTYLLRQSSGDANLARLLDKIESGRRRTLLLVSEHVVNFPPQVAARMHESLFEDIQAAQEAAPKGDFSNIDNVLILSTLITVLPESSDSNGNERQQQQLKGRGDDDDDDDDDDKMVEVQKKKKKKKEEEEEAVDDEEPFLIKPEEEPYARAAEWMARFPLPVAKKDEGFPGFMDADVFREHVILSVKYKTVKGQVLEDMLDAFSGLPEE